MQLSVCECGEYTSYGSIPPNRCAQCSKCGTHPTLNGIGQPAKPQDHEWCTEQVETDEGFKPHTSCSFCGISKGKVVNLKGVS